MGIACDVVPSTATVGVNTWINQATQCVLYEKEDNVRADRHKSLNISSTVRLKIGCYDKERQDMVCKMAHASAND